MITFESINKQKVSFRLERQRSEIEESCENGAKKQKDPSTMAGMTKRENEDKHSRICN